MTCSLKETRNYQPPTTVFKEAPHMIFSCRNKFLLIFLVFQRPIDLLRLRSGLMHQSVQFERPKFSPGFSPDVQKKDSNPRSNKLFKLGPRGQRTAGYPLQCPRLYNFRVESAHIHACKQYIWWSYNKPAFNTVHFDRNTSTCSCEGKRKDLMIFDLAFLLVVFRVTAWQAWQLVKGLRLLSCFAS